MCEPTENVLCDKPKHVSEKTWQKFQSLKKRKVEMSAKEEALGSGKKIRQHRSRMKTKLQLNKNESINAKPSKRDEDIGIGRSQILDDSEDFPEEWKKVKSYIGCNDHLKADHLSSDKSSLERHLDEAITNKDYKKAEEISDHLAYRHIGTRITEAIDAKHFEDANKRKVERDAAKKNKLAWGFQTKQRWETKSNM